jgi:hypothetical protein
LLHDDKLGVYPDRETYATSGTAYCFMFYDWEKPVSRSWLSRAQEIFAQFGKTISEGTANLGKQHSHGGFKRVQKRLLGFLDAMSDNAGAHFDIRVWSEHYVKTDAWFPCDIEMVWGMHASGTKKGMLAVRDTLVPGLEALIERAAEPIFELTGAAYATVFPFPTLFGPDTYLASVGSIPSGMSSLANSTYTARITRWRDHRWNGYLTSQGYLREVYPVNFVLRSHLEMPFNGRPLCEYMTKVGSLKPSQFNDRVYCWAVPAERLLWVRQELEPSGLVLSSTQAPLRVGDSPVEKGTSVAGLH